MRQLKPGVSIVIPTYNMADTVMTAVKSAYEQWGVNQVIVVDDGSTDYTDELRKGLGIIGCPDVEWVRRPHNGGTGAALNSGLAYVEHEWYMGMGADDKLGEDCINTLRRVGEGDYGTGRHDVVGPVVVNMGDKTGLIAPKTNKESLRQGPGAWGVSLVRTEKLLSVGGYESCMPYKVCEDWELWCRMWSQGATFARTSTAHYLYTHKEGRLYEDRVVYAEVQNFLKNRYPHIWEEDSNGA